MSAPGPRWGGWAVLGPLELQLQLWTSPPHLCPSACTAFPSCKKQCSSTQGEWQLDGASLSNPDSWAQGPLGSWEARARWVSHQVKGSSSPAPGVRDGRGGESLGSGTKASLQALADKGPRGRMNHQALSAGFVLGLVAGVQEALTWRRVKQEWPCVITIQLAWLTGPGWARGPWQGCGHQHCSPRLRH